MTATEILLALLWALAAAGVTWYGTAIAAQTSYVTLADGRRSERRIALGLRLLLPLVPTLTPLFRSPRLAESRERTTRRLSTAGFEGLLSAEEYFALRILSPLVYGALWLILIWGLMSSEAGGALRRAATALYVMGPVYAVLYPGLWLRRALQARLRSIQRALPFVLDLLTLSVEAGMDFMTALQRCVERRSIGPLDEELIRVIREIQLGKTRRQALRDLSHRLDIGDIRLVVNALVQADQLGVSIGSILRIQADQIRQRRFERGEKLANEAPVKLLFPLMAFIFPAVFLILLGPVVMKLVQQGL